jgi:heme A synthase
LLTIEIFTAGNLLFCSSVIIPVIVWLIPEKEKSRKRKKSPLRILAKIEFILEYLTLEL